MNQAMVRAFALAFGAINHLLNAENRVSVEDLTTFTRSQFVGDEDLNQNAAACQSIFL